MRYRLEAFRQANDSRKHGVSVDIDYLERSLKSQMKFADKLGARKVAIIGEDELKGNYVILRDMETREQTRVPSGDLVKALL